METKAKKCIYVLEDNANIAEIIAFLLEEEEYDVAVCKNTNLFWKKMEEHTPDMVVLDVNLPDGNGSDVCLKLKRNIRTHKIPVLMMSAHQQLNRIKNKCDADSYINKPFDIDDFLGRIDHFSHLA